MDGEESKNLQVKLTDGTEIPLNILESTGDSNKDRAIGYFVSDDSSIPAVPLSNEYAGAGDQVINAGFPGGVAMDTRAFEHFRTRADSIEYDKKPGVTQIIDTTYLTEHSLNKNPDTGFNGEVISSDENRYLYDTNLSGLPGQSGSPLFKITNNNLEIIGVTSCGPHGSYNPETGSVIINEMAEVTYNPQITLNKKDKTPFGVNLEFTRFASVNSKINYPNLEKTIQDIINKENQNSK